ncbi:MAG: pentapeptide repeat-containing protein [Pseudomonadales bacterium]|nr:pentapeptide repeat-containing protein [Pseudomonadales bacterium]
MRKNFEETIEILRKEKIVFDDQSPRLPEAVPKYDDEDPCGFSVFRMGLEGKDLSDLDMRRTFFAKSEVSDGNFTNTDLSESNLCWNDFISVNFNGAKLSNSDLRASIYDRVNFSNCDLSGSDLRQSDFTNCQFSGANMVGAKLTRNSTLKLTLSAEQMAEVNWQDSEGEAPGGG